MRADSALSHLYDDELCIAILQDGTQHAVRWNRMDWRFHYADTNAVCPHDAIKDWRPASIHFDPAGNAEKGFDHGQAT